MFCNFLLFAFLDYRSIPLISQQSCYTKSLVSFPLKKGLFCHPEKRESGISTASSLGVLLRSFNTTYPTTWHLSSYFNDKAGGEKKAYNWKIELKRIIICISLMKSLSLQKSRYSLFSKEKMKIIRVRKVVNSQYFIQHVSSWWLNRVCKVQGICVHRHYCTDAVAIFIFLGQ